MTRVHDSDRSRAKLLEAAHDLFSERGFDGTTTRQIAEAAGVDAALISRYFGNKEKLYIAAVAVDGAGTALPSPAGEIPPESITPAGIAAWILRRTQSTGPGPIIQALVRPETAPDIRAAAADRLRTLLIDPLAQHLAESKVPEPRLRAEVVIFTAIGLVIGRAQPGGELATADQADLERLIGSAMNRLTSPY